MNVQVQLDIPMKKIQGLLCNAFEGGSNYWYVIDKFGKPTEFVNHSDAFAKKGEKPEVFRHLDYPTNPGGYLIISDKEGDKRYCSKRLDITSIKAGLTLMSTKQPRHFGNFMSDNDDADTGDVFLQLCLFGEVIFG